jgi:hypothetical protein
MLSKSELHARKPARPQHKLRLMRHDIVGNSRA